MKYTFESRHLFRVENHARVAGAADARGKLDDWHALALRWAREAAAAAGYARETIDELVIRGIEHGRKGAGEEP